MSPRQKLQAARQAIQRLDPLAADMLLREIESQQPVAAKDRAAVAQDLVAIRDLALAALEGIGSAHAQLTQLLLQAQTLDTYDRSGNRQVRDMSIPVTRKF